MKYTINPISDDLVNTVVRQLGAISVKTKSANVNIATFQLSENIRIKYKYEMKEDEPFYLQRISPYPLLIGTCETTDQLLAMLRKDLKMFQRAYKSSNFPEFLAIMTKLTEARRRTEDLFLHYNIPAESLTQIDQDLLAIFHGLRDAKRSAAPIAEPVFPDDDFLMEAPDPADTGDSVRERESN